MRLQDIATKPTSQKINRINENRFGFRIDYKKLSVAKARELSEAMGANMAKLRHNFGIHTAEKNPRYMEMLMVREGLNRWIEENTQLNESEIAKSGAILAAKDMVDSMQDMLEDISKMQNEQLPALLDTIRDQIGQPQADAFKSAIVPMLQACMEAITNGRETADAAARQLAGEQVAQPMDMGGSAAGGMGAEPALPAPDMGNDIDGEEDIDGFDATDAAAGGDLGLGREKR
jgi:hypothetical protein